MLKKRLIAGFAMTFGMLALLLADASLASLLPVPFYPFLFCFSMVAGYLAVVEMVGLIAEPNRPLVWVCAVGVLSLFVSHFYQAAASAYPGFRHNDPTSWSLQAYLGGGFVLMAFLVEMYRYRATGHSIAKIAHSLLVVAYLGVLPSFFMKLRWLTVPDWPNTTGLMLALGIFVPKIGDVAAFFVGRFFGRNKVTPLLSPKKTWEGFLGSFGGSLFAAYFFHLFGPVFRGGWLEATLFGIAIGFVGFLGDLAESLIKRDGNRKDASQSVPGFGGLLDVFDSVIFAGPATYLWFTVMYGLI